MLWRAERHVALAFTRLLLQTLGRVGELANVAEPVNARDLLAGNHRVELPGPGVDILPDDLCACSAEANL